jgi:aminopeptidase-like protein
MGGSGVTGPLQHLESPDAALALARKALELVGRIYPLCRSITGDGVRATLRLVGQSLPLEVSEVPSGTAVFDWEIPPEWNIRDAYIADAAGRRLVDFRANALHVVGYSVPVHARMTLQQLRPHLYTLPERPDWIPYRTSYYQLAWGFCLAHRQLEGWPEGEYEVVIDSELKPGSLTYAECLVPGTSDREILIYTHTCHPALANDNATGIAVAALLAEEALKSSPNLSYRFIFAPGTIGSIAWLARNEAQLARVRGGLAIGLLGDRGALTFKRSRRHASELDLIAAQVVREVEPTADVLDFSPYGYDERQFCSPGIDLPVGRLTRSPNDAFAEYHTSADTPSLLDENALARSILALATILNRIDGNRLYRNRSPKGEPRLGKRGLFRATGGASPGDFEHAMLWLLNLADGEHGLQDAQAASCLPLELLRRAAQALAEADLLEEVPN